MIHLAPFAVLALLSAVMLWRLGRYQPTAATVLAWLLVFTAYAAATEPLGHPKPMRVEVFRNLDRAVVSYHEADPERGIYIVSGRRAYTLPYDEQLARQLYAATMKAEAEGGDVVLSQSRNWLDGGERPQAGWEPPPPLPPKG